MRGNLLTLHNHLLAGLGQRRAANHERPRAVGAHAELHAVGVAKHDVDIVEGDAELFRYDLRKSRLVPLPVIMGAYQDRHLPGRMDANGGALVEAGAGPEATRETRRRKAAGFDIGREAKTAKFAIAFRFGLAFGKSSDSPPPSSAPSRHPIGSPLNHIRPARASGTDMRSFGIMLRRRSSTRSIPISAAATSTSRSTTKVASGRPAPR